MLGFIVFNNTIKQLTMNNLLNKIIIAYLFLRGRNTSICCFFLTRAYIPNLLSVDYV